MNYNMVERCERIECLEDLIWIYSNGSQNVIDKYIIEKNIIKENNTYNELLCEKFDICKNIIENKVVEVLKQCCKSFTKDKSKYNLYDGETAIQILCEKILDESKTFITSENIDKEFYTKFQIEFDLIPLELIKVWRIIPNIQMCTDEEIKFKLLNFINTNENIRNDIELIREYIDLSILLFDSVERLGGLSGIKTKIYGEERILLNDLIMLFKNDELELTLAHEIGHKIARLVNEGIIREEFSKVTDTIGVEAFKGEYPDNIINNEDMLTEEIFADYYAYVNAKKYRKDNRLQSIIDKFKESNACIDIEEKLQIAFEMAIKTNNSLYNKLSMCLEPEEIEIEIEVE